MAQSKKGTTPLRPAKRDSAGQASTKTTRTSGPKVDVFDIKGKVVEKISLPENIFAAKENPTLVAQAVRVHLANKRQGTAKTKSRGEINATTKKVWRQKGTGRARHGAKSAPIFVGGGVTFGQNPRDYSLSLPKKMRQSALFSVLTTRLKEESIKVISGMEKIEPKTKQAFAVLGNLSLTPKTKTVVLVIDGKAQNVYKAARNIEGVEVMSAKSLNAYDALKSSILLFTKEGIDLLTLHVNKEEKKV